MPIDISTFSAQEQATLVYVAYFDRAPDPAGLQFYGQLIAAGTITAAQAATDFSGAAETKLKYPYFDTPDVATASTFITSVYASLFGRAPDAAGLDFWTAELVGGKVPVGEIILDIAAGAQGDDIAVVTNKIEVGLGWAQTAADAGVGTSINPIAAEVDGEFVVYDADAFSSATTVLDGVDATAASVAAAKATTASYFADAINEGETVNLKTGQDDIQIDTLGTVDTVRGIMNDDGLTDDDTFSSGDIIDGNGLTEVRITLVDGTTPDFVEMEGVNSLEFRGAGETGAVTFDASNYGTDLNNFKLSGGDKANVIVDNVEFDEGSLTFTIAEGTTGALDVDGTVGAALTADLDTTGEEGAYLIVDFGNTGIEAFAGEGADVEFDATIDVTETGADAIIDAVNVGNVNMVGGVDSTVDLKISLSASANISGDASVGDVTIGTVDMMGALSADMDAFSYRYAYADEGNAKIGNLVGGDVMMSVGKDGDFSVSISASATAADTGDASIGNTTIGNLTITAADKFDDADFYFDNFAFADIGNASIGDMTMGDIDVDLGTTGSTDVTVSISRTATAATTGDATVGSTTIGNINVVIGESSDLYLDVRQYADAVNGNATVGDITVGDFDVDMEDDGFFRLTLSNSADAVKGDATLGSITIGDVSLTQSSGADAYIYAYAYADGTGANNGIVGDLTLGDVTSVMGLDSYLDISVSADATGNGTMTAIGDVSVGNVTLSGPLAIGASATLEVTLDSDGTIGAVTVGDVDVDFLADSTFDYYFGVFAAGDAGAVNLGAVDVVADSIDYEVSVSVDNLLGGIGIGDIKLAGDDIAWSSIYLFASGDIGDVNVGNIMIDAATNLFVDEGIYISAVGDVGNVTIGDISIMTAESDTFDVFVYAGDNVGDVTIGNLESTVSNTGFKYEVTVSGGADVENVSIGDIDLSANATKSNADVTANLTFDAAPGDGLGNVTIGDINLAAAGAADLYASAYVTVDIGDDATAVGDVTFGDLTVTATAENIATAADVFNHDVYGGLYVNTTGGDISSVTVGDVNFTLTNSVDDSTAFAVTDEYNVAHATLSIDLASAITVGDINLTAINESKVDVQGGIGIKGLFSFNITLSADGGAEDVTIGDITISGGGLDTSGDSIDNLAALTDFLSLTGDTITVGDIDYSGYSSAASIDVSGYEGAANITASSGGSDITVNTTQNLITLGDGDDTVIYEANETSGTTYADIDKIINFSSGDDIIDFSFDADVSDKAVAGTFADYDAFLVAAQAVMSKDGTIDVFVGNDGTNTYVAIESDDDVGDTIDYAIELTGVTGLSAGDFVT